MFPIFKVLFVYFAIQSAHYFHTSTFGGIIIGLIIGHVLDHIAYVRLISWRVRRDMLKKARAAFDDQFLGSLFYLFGKICGVDGVIAKSEIDVVEDIMANGLKLSYKQQKKAKDAFRGARNSSSTFQSKAVTYFDLYQAHPEVLEGTILMFLKLATADGKLLDIEERLIKTAASVFGIEEEHYLRLRAPYLPQGGKPADIDRCYAVLGCKKSDSVDDIKRSYRKLVVEFHPDKIVSKGLPQEFLEFANQKFKDIQTAYEFVKAERGFN